MIINFKLHYCTKFKYVQEMDTYMTYIKIHSPLVWGL